MPFAMRDQSRQHRTPLRCPHVQFLVRVDDVPPFSVQTVAVVKLAPQERVQKRTVEQVVNVSVEMQRQIPVIQKVQETVQVQQVQYNDRNVNVPLCGSVKYDPLGNSTEHDEVPRMCLRIPEVDVFCCHTRTGANFPKSAIDTSLMQLTSWRNNSLHCSRALDVHVAMPGQVHTIHSRSLFG